MNRHIRASLGVVVAGAAVLLISDDLDEVLTLGDQVAVLHAGHLAPPRRAEDWSREAIGLAISLGLLFTVFVYFGYEHHWLGLGTTADQTSTATVELEILSVDDVPVAADYDGDGQTTEADMRGFTGCMTTDRPAGCL